MTPRVRSVAGAAAAALVVAAGAAGAPRAAAQSQPSLTPPAGLPAGGPRAAYETSLGKPPRVFVPAGSLGRRWSGTPSYVAGVGVYSRGEYVYSDTPFDDTGADTVLDTEPTGLQSVYDGLCGAGALYRHGDSTYPSDAAYGANAADLVEWRLAADDRWYYTLLRFETLIEARTTVGRVLVDADGLPGFEHVLSLAGTGTDGVTATLDGVPVEARADLAANTFEARLPATSIPAGTWQVAVTAGTATQVFDLAFVSEAIAGEFNCWADRRQSQLITAGTYPSRAIDIARLRSGFSEPPSLLHGPLVRMHSPSIALGEGTIGQPKYSNESTRKIYRGSVQPYAAYVPRSYDPSRSNPLIVLLHCLNCNHNTFHIAAWPGLTELAEARGAIIVTPLAYGEGGHYEEEAEYDVFDVLADVSARYRIDRERIYLTGMSMGALGTFRLGLLYPDLWARAFSIGNYTNPNCVTPSQKSPPPGYCVAPFNYFTILENARNVPWGLVNGALDELTPITGAEEIADRFAELGYAYRFWTYLERRHEPSLHGTTTDVTSPFLGDARRVTAPARVTYAVERALQDVPWRLVYDRAYWLRDIRLADGAARGTVDATSGRGATYATAPVTASGTSAAGPYELRGADPTWTIADGGNTLTLRLRGVASLTVLLADAGLRAKGLRLTVDTDTTVTVALQGQKKPLVFPPGKHSQTLG